MRKILDFEPVCISGMSYCHGVQCVSKHCEIMATRFKTVAMINSGGKRKDPDKERAYKKNKLFRRIESDIKDRDRKRIPGNFLNFKALEM